MILLDENATRAALPWLPLIDALDEGFRTGCSAPARHHHDVGVPDGADGTLLLMPAWQPGGYMCVKIAAVFPDNAKQAMPAVHAQVMLMSASTGKPVALIDGGELTARRTAAASALAARYLARPDAKSLLVVGSGRVALNLAKAMARIRTIETVTVWGRTAAHAERMVAELREAGLVANPTSDLQAAAREADIISTATISDTPLIKGAWLKPGAHLDLVGAFKPSLRESDDDAIVNNSLFVDTRVGATREAGDIMQPLNAGLIKATHIRADLADLAVGGHKGRESDSEITVFKSVGTALEDLAAAVLAYERHVAA